ncbi:MAG: glycosyltransferase [Gemmatimonadetes bacterium]|nr:glycosyltransferase [Gemmatimonadota bacterium]
MSLVSIITPCYNAEGFVGETIESVAAQTYPEIEHIVVDDCSSDGSWEVIRSYRDRVRALRLERNRGGSHARNRGAELARGQFLMFLDADDVITPGTVAALVEALRDHSRAVAACRWQRLVPRDGRWRLMAPEAPFPVAGDDHLRGWLGGIWVPPCAILWQREVYELVGRWDERITWNDDGDLMMRALAHGVQLVLSDHEGALYRAHGDSRVSLSTNYFTERPLRSQMWVLENLTAELQQLGKLPAYEEPIGVIYKKLAILCFQQNYPVIGRECLQRGEALIGGQVVCRTWMGRLLTRLVGVERKEQIANALARRGLMTAERNRFFNLRRVHDAAQC